MLILVELHAIKEEVEVKDNMAVIDVKNFEIVTLKAKL